MTSWASFWSFSHNHTWHEWKFSIRISRMKRTETGPAEKKTLPSGWEYACMWFVCSLEPSPLWYVSLVEIHTWIMMNLSSEMEDMMTDQKPLAYSDPSECFFFQSFSKLHFFSVGCLHCETQSVCIRQALSKIRWKEMEPLFPRWGCIRGASKVVQKGEVQ